MGNINKPKPYNVLKALSDSFNYVFDQSAVAGRPDLIGEPREGHIREFLKSSLPAQANVTRGYILSREESGVTLSSEFDIIVYDSTISPKFSVNFFSDRDIVPLEAVIAVLEIKSVLDNDQCENVSKKVKELDSICDSHYSLNNGRNVRPYFLVYGYRRGKISSDYMGTIYGYFDDYLNTGVGQPDVLFIGTGEWFILERRIDNLIRALQFKNAIPLDVATEDSEYLSYVENKAANESRTSVVDDYIVVPSNNLSVPLSLVAFLTEAVKEHDRQPINVLELLGLWASTPK